MSKVKNPKFDRKICENCQNYWDSVTGDKVCHISGKHIYLDYCMSYLPIKTRDKDKEIENAYESYQRDWN